MTFQLTWLAEVLEAAGLKVAEVPGWRSRGRAEMGVVRGVMCHHTANNQKGNMPTLGQLVHGRAASSKASALAGPLAQLGIGRDGTIYVVAAGRANHAGQGFWENVTNGNSNFIGIEAENNGVDEPWPEVQMDAYKRCVAAILKKIGAGANMCCGHKEYATPPGRKIDPDFDMSLFRRDVASFLAGRTPPPPIPAADGQQRPTLRRGSVGSLVGDVQARLGVQVTNSFDGDTEAALRQKQRDAGLVPDGILGPKSWKLLDELATEATVQPNEPPPAVAVPEPPIVDAPTPDGGPTPAAEPTIALPPADEGDDSLHLDGKAAIGPDGKRFAFRTKLGYFSPGETSLGAWLDGTSTAVPPSVLRVVKAMCANEGNLEAVNSYDDAHMSFGIFQWTAGEANTPGELAALLAAFKQVDADAYAECFGRFGLEAEVTSATATTGLLKLNGVELRTAGQKDELRSIVWAYRFWRAGHHPALRASELALAAQRIGRFTSLQTLRRPLHDWITSELGIALVLDEHVNRPGHVPGTLERRSKRWKTSCQRTRRPGRARMSTWSSKPTSLSETRPR